MTRDAGTTGGLLRLATAGSVDDGKSTLVGRLLIDSDSVFTDQFDALGGTDGLEVDLALLTDGLRAEREQGITIDVAFRYFSTAHRRFVLADTPGHVQYNRNTVSGMSLVDAVVVLVDVRTGLRDQARRHLAAASLLRVPHVIVAVNKMDAVGFDEGRFTRLRDEVLDCTRRLGVEDVVVIPLSALRGDNVVTRSQRTPWYDGPTLLKHLEEVPAGSAAAAGPARLPVQCVLRGAEEPARFYAGRLGTGSLAPGDEVLILPSRTRSRVRRVRRLGDPVERAEPGQSVEIQLADDVDVSRGDLIAGLPAPVLATEFTAVICCVSDHRLREGEPLLVKHGTRTARGVLRDIRSTLDLTTMSYTPAGDVIGGNDIAVVSILTAEPLPIEPYRDDRITGSFLLLDPEDGSTTAAGMAEAAASTDSTAELAAAGRTC
ncbi:GTP-binding protein [Amycolatopsis sp. QT-25]|uniref:sulfate adenylyltransferase subunit 1 n=1 Tax=Amycolatopsis sp. QT-25 TaxID=3034022 RepID=UPI0023EAA572|nr:GTP-binding protein [Amycolatopsis sp. QT-25]WET81844.1 GTP-binding protein [Amycolatopsis sp. QT-25]